MAGRFLVDLIETTVQKVARSATSSRRERLEQLALEGKKLRNTLLKVGKAKEATTSCLVWPISSFCVQTYTGERLRQTLDWSLSSAGDDVTSYTNQLTEMERRLFQCGAVAATAHLRWRVDGKSKWLIRSQPKNNSQATAVQNGVKRARAVSPENETEAQKHTRQRR
jgi:hypothetical protein